MAANDELWALIEEDIVHTKDLSKEDAEEMLKRYQDCFPDIDFYIVPNEVAELM
jgi:hypothetical protein